MGKADKFLPLYIGDYLADTTMLTRDQHGGYLLLIMAYWRNRGPLPDNDQTLAATTRSTPAEWKKLRPVLAAFFVVKDGVWLHKRIDRELQSADQQYAARIERAKVAAEKRWSKQCSEHAPSMPQACSKHAPSNAQAMLEECQPQPQPHSLGKPSEGRARQPWPPDAVVPDGWIELAALQRRRLGLAEIDLAVAASMFANHYAADVANPRTLAEFQAKWMNWALKEKANETRRNGGKSQLEQLAEIVRNAGG